MAGNRKRRLAWAGCALACTVLLVCRPAKGQQRAGTATPDLTDEVRTLSETVRELQAQVESLSSQLTELRAREQRNDSGGAGSPASADLQKTSAATAVADPYLTFPAGAPAPASSMTGPPNSSSASETIGERVAQLEEDQDLTDSKLADQYQTKVESGSKYRLRLSGMLLLNMFENRGVVDNADFPGVALEPGPLNSAGTFGATLRQSQVGLQVFGPEVAGAHTSADIRFDFAGGFPNAPNGTVLGLVRLRTGTVRLDWSNTSVVAGQDFLFFSPLTPTSLATFATPPLSYAGNLWAWTPQVRIEHRVHFSDRSSLMLAGGILDSLSGDSPSSTYDRSPTWGEQSGEPAYAARLAWSERVLGQNLVIGTGGYYGAQYWGLGRHVNGWATTADLTLPLGKYFGLTAQFYRGRALGGLGGGIGQDVLLAGLVTSPAPIEGLDSMGGWAQLKFKPTQKFEVNGALGIDNPFGSEFRRFPNSVSYYGVALTKNISPFVNFIYQLRSDLLFSVEYQYLKTFEFEDEAYSANHTTVSLGYIF